MKRFISMLLICAMCSTLCACSNSAGDASSKAYTPPDNVELVYIGPRGYKGGGIAPIIKNNSEKVIKNLTIKVLPFDRNGYPIGDTIDGVASCEYKSVNLLSGEQKILEVLPVLVGVPYECQYIEGAISYIEYMDGSIWESNSIEAWAKDNKTSFDIEAWKAKIENMKEHADKAISENNYMTIATQCTMKNGHVYVTFSSDIKDIGNQAITAFTILMLCYDENGFPVETECGTLARNSYSFPLSGNSGKSNAHGTGNLDFYLFGKDVKAMKSIISEIEFSDGTVWENPFAPYWELYYGDVVGK